MHIQWFPGHMTKAMRMMQESIKLVDCVIYVLDSRAIASCINPKFDEMIGNKPILYIFNKSDMVDSMPLRLWQKKFILENKTALIVNSIGGKDRTLIIDRLRDINKVVVQKFANKGARKVIRAMVVGVPNTGKSTLINSLCQSKRAITGNIAGVTKGKQWVTLAEGIELLDTPGSLPPAFEDQQKALHLTFIGSIKEDVVFADELAIEMIIFCRQNCKTQFMQRYNLQNFDEDNVKVFDDIASSKGYILSKRETDYDRIAKVIIDDFKKQRFGKIMLDLPQDN